MFTDDLFKVVSSELLLFFSLYLMIILWYLETVQVILFLIKLLIYSLIYTTILFDEYNLLYYYLSSFISKSPVKLVSVYFSHISIILPGLSYTLPALAL